MHRTEDCDTPMSGMDCGRLTENRARDADMTENGYPSTREGEGESTALEFRSDQGTLSPQAEGPAALRTAATERSKEKLGGKDGSLERPGLQVPSRHLLARAADIQGPQRYLLKTSRASDSALLRVGEENVLLASSSVSLGWLLVRAFLPVEGHSKRSFPCFSQLEDSRSYGQRQNEMLHSNCGPTKIRDQFG